MEDLGKVKGYAFRLHRGDDLKNSIEDFCTKNNLSACAIVSAVGCVSKINLRMAKAEKTLILDEDFEIVSCIGTISSGNSHIHCSFSKEDGSVIGGHLLKGCIINTTCEVVLIELTDHKFSREYDEETGYDEIIIEESK